MDASEETGKVCFSQLIANSSQKIDLDGLEKVFTKEGQKMLSIIYHSIEAVEMRQNDVVTASRTIIVRVPCRIRSCFIDRQNKLPRSDEGVLLPEIQKLHGLDLAEIFSINDALLGLLQFTMKPCDISPSRFAMRAWANMTSLS